VKGRKVEGEMKMSRGEGVVEDPTPGGRASPRAADPVCIDDPFQHVIGSMLCFANNPAAAGRGRDPSPIAGHDRAPT
jgi:hypothetical protein